MPPHKTKVAIIGAGIAGLSCAVRLLEQYPDADATVIADTFSPHTTSDGAAGYWRPFTLANTPDHLQTKWALATWYYLNDLLLSRNDSHKIGLSRAFGFVLSDYKEDMPEWAKLIPGNREATAEELKMYFPPKAIYGLFGPTIMCEFKFFSKYLSERFQSMGGKIQRGKVEKLTDLASDYDVVFNCAGHGATELCNDPLNFTLRGHVVRVRAPWLRSTIVFASSKNNEQFMHILPNQDSVVIGGTKVPKNIDTTPTKEQRDEILRRAAEFEPSLKDAEVLSEWAGFRPVRDTVRLELENIPVPGKGYTLPVVHNYGMGGAGLSIGWGCAIDVVNIFDDVVKSLHNDLKLQRKAKL